MGLFYLRHPDDDSQGGDLELYKYKTNNFKYYGQRFIQDKYIEKVKTIKYERNTLVIFLNSINSIHGVSNRSVTNHPRLFVNILGGQLREPLFSLDKYKENIIDKVLRHLSN